MALTNTTLATVCSATDLTLNVTSTASGFPGIGVLGSRQLMRIDAEYMMIDYVVKSGVVKVMMRGMEGGGPAAAHDILAAISTSSDPQDFSKPPAGTQVLRSPWLDDVQTIGEDLAFTAAGTAPIPAVSIPIPSRNTTYYINKGSAAAITLISATAAEAGVQLRFINMGAFANTITYTPGFLGDTTASDVATAAAKVGAILELQCGPTGLWASLNGDLLSSHDSSWTLG